MAKPAPSNINQQHSWHDLTEKELLEYEFTTSEPELLAGMSEEQPPPGRVVVEFEYDVTGRKEKARCVHCKYPNHFKGFVIRVSDGTRRQVGKDCGRILYGAQFGQAHQDFNAARDLASALKRRQRLLNAEPILMDGLRTLLQHRSLRRGTCG